MTRTPAQVEVEVKHLAASKADIGVNDCQLNAHNIYLIPSDGTPTAAAAYERAKHKHPLPANPTHADLMAIPLMAFVFWTGGKTISKATGKPAGHVALWAGFVGGVPMVWSPGAPGASAANHWTLVPLASIATGWPGHVLAGWTEDIDGVRVAGLIPPKPKPKRPAEVRQEIAHLKQVKEDEAGHPTRQGHIEDAIADLKQVKKQ